MKLLLQPAVFLLLSILLASCGTADNQEPPAPPGMIYVAGGEWQGRPVPSFYMDRTELTVDSFAAFIAATGYVTTADSFGWSGVFSADSLAWLPVDSANWQYPLGPARPAAAGNEPVVQLSFFDVQAYAAWAGKSVPTAAEWRWAATQRGTNRRFPWGEAMPPPAAAYPGNWWQGPFPYENENRDGYLGIAPAASFPPAPNGLYDLSGNVWEWTATARPGTGEYVILGGSFLCSTSYCSGFDLTQQQFTLGDSGLNHLGVRLVQYGPTREPDRRRGDSRGGTPAN